MEKIADGEKEANCVVELGADCDIAGNSRVKLVMMGRASFGVATFRAQQVSPWESRSIGILR